uniref:Recoverin 2 n=1 Tax=Acanthochromis polyacanthus TaxID=80966 RepID=A0A3Q1FLZ3_9TELE
MGNTTSSALSKEILEDLKLGTKFTETEISQWYENFQKQCPTGRITPEEFEQIYERFFPESDAKSYARHVFRSFDTNDDGTLDFKEYIIALHMTSTGKTTRKLEWAFSLFDVDKNGYINKTEVTEICQVGRLGSKPQISERSLRTFTFVAPKKFLLRLKISSLTRKGWFQGNFFSSRSYKTQSYLTEC